MKTDVVVQNVLMAIAFFAVANPKTYGLVNKVVPVLKDEKDGEPTQLGVGLHAIVFLMVISLMAFLKAKMKL